MKQKVLCLPFYTKSGTFVVNEDAQGQDSQI